MIQGFAFQLSNKSFVLAVLILLDRKNARQVEVLRSPGSRPNAIVMGSFYAEQGFYKVMASR
jgi:hypothetical protein